MTKPLFTVVPPRSTKIQATTPFILHRDGWDDFGFKTQYQIEYVGGRESILIGSVKILKKGQGTTSRGLLEDGLLHALDSSFCSVGQSLDYYQRLSELPDDLRTNLLSALRDVIAHPDIIESFESEEAWRVSLWRDMDEQEFRQLAPVLLHQNYSTLPDIDVHLNFEVAGWLAPLSLNFEAPEEDYYSRRTRSGPLNRLQLPRRVAVLTGRNGSGKSTLLARLARILHASQPNRARKALLQLGRLDPVGVGFTRIVTISYSAFDAFQVPGLTRGERRQIAKDIDNGSGRFIFCGLRDIARELKEELDAEPNADETLPFDTLRDRQRKTYLKPLEQLAREFARTITRVMDRGRLELLEGTAALLLRDPSFGNVEDQSLLDLVGDDPEEAFLRWSTGHKIVLHSLACLAAYLEPKSILLFDEPETHLHPPLLAALMHGIRHMLEELDAFGVIATHSPVVAQETLARHVHIVRRSGMETTIASPLIETFGESIGEITDEVFGLNSDATDYHNILERLVRRHKTLEAVEALFDEGLSLQARAYVMSLIARQDMKQ